MVHQRRFGEPAYSLEEAAVGGDHLLARRRRRGVREQTVRVEVARERADRGRQDDVILRVPRRELEELRAGEDSESMNTAPTQQRIETRHLPDAQADRKKRVPLRAEPK